jgi:hypothetical protein
MYQNNEDFIFDHKEGVWHNGKGGFPSQIVLGERIASVSVKSPFRWDLLDLCNPNREVKHARTSAALTFLAAAEYDCPKLWCWDADTLDWIRQGDAKKRIELLYNLRCTEFGDVVEAATKRLGAILSDQ